MGIGIGVGGAHAADRDHRNVGDQTLRLQHDVGREAVEAGDVRGAARLDNLGVEGGNRDRHILHTFGAVLRGDENFAVIVVGAGGGQIVSASSRESVCQYV